jgi:hypothetical protein
MDFVHLKLNDTYMQALRLDQILILSWLIISNNIYIALQGQITTNELEGMAGFSHLGVNG